MTSTNETPVQSADDLALTSTDQTSATWQLSALTEALGDLTLTVTDSLSVGRGSDNDVVLGSKEVSRNHAVLSVLNDKLYVKDLDSSNGTFVNNQRIESNKSKYIKLDDTISFASFTFQVLKVQDIAADIIEPSEILEVDAVLNSHEISQPAPTDATATEALTAAALPATDEHLAAQESTITDAKAEAVEVLISNDDRVNILEVRPAASANNENIKSAQLEDSVPDPLEDIVVDNEPTNEPLATATTNDYDQRIDNVSEVHPASSNSAELENSVPDPLQEDAGSAPARAAETIITETLVNEAPAQDHAVKDDHLAKTSTPVEAEALSSRAPAAPIKAEVPVNEETLISEPVLEKPLIAEPEAVSTPIDNMSQSAQLASDHDKTTTTPLQEEADPDILRAKQAATAQFSGTANLGAPRDVGTEGNNALNQAIDNPANPDAATKKPSGAWFIWVFAAVVIIGIAIWLFNMGGM